MAARRCRLRADQRLAFDEFFESGAEVGAVVQYFGSVITDGC